ncbi:queuosine biosynthesis protein QueC [Elusimicrobium simillimum]|uniref:7-cyano-7-deazaguanine synthase QueC n=1 Tax=Elusimicrobium simillimum TaxID=3143438 RepID=UPI003C6F3DE3
MNTLVARAPSECEDWQGNAVVIDVLRSATTVCALIKKGKKDIKLFGDKELAARYKLANPKVELYSELTFDKNIIKEDNSPYAASKSSAKTPAAIVTTAGTPAVMALKNAKNIFMGGYCNILTLVSYLKTQEEDVLLVPSNLFGHISDVEDALCAESFMSLMIGLGDIEQDVESVQSTARYEDFLKNGPKTAAKDAKLAFDINAMPVIPMIKIVGDYGIVATPFTMEEAIKEHEASLSPAEVQAVPLEKEAPLPAKEAKEEIVSVPLRAKKKAVIMFSGGMDSTVCLYWAMDKGYECEVLTVSYGQKHLKEVEVARALAEDAGVKFNHVELNLPWLAAATSLVGLGEIPNTPFEEIGANGVPSTYVPARNLMFTALGASLADSIGAEAIVLGPNAVDYSGYPDCTPEFYKPLTEAVKVGTRLGKKFELLTPIIKLNKAEIVKLGRKLGVPLERTWTCYRGGDKPCGECESCKLRKKGFEDAGEKEEY